MSRAGLVGLCGLLALAGWPARASEPVNPFLEWDEGELLRNEERVVTIASRTPQTLARASSVVTVLTAAEIRERGYRTLADVLGSIPGVYISVSEDGRRLAWVRGVTAPENDRILLLVDGVPWHDGLSNHAWIDEYLPLNIVRQVEVIRGPASASYGTNALAAVINVVTYGARDLRGGFVRGEVGSYGRGSLMAVFGDRVGQNGPLGVRGYARATRADGDGLELSPDGARDLAADAPVQALGAGLKLAYRGLELRYDHVSYAHDALIPAQQDVEELLLHDPDATGYRYGDDLVSARWEIVVGPLLRLTPEGFAQRYDAPSVDARLEPALDGATEQISLIERERRTARYGLGVRGELRPGLDHLTLFGVGSSADHLIAVEDRLFEGELQQPEPGGLSAPRTLLADLYGFAQHQWTPAWWIEVYGGLRVDRRDYRCLVAEDRCDLPAGHLQASPRLGLTLAPDSALGFKAVYGRAFRSPSARELLVEVEQDASGHNLAPASDARLRPEHVDALEAEFVARPTRDLTLRLDGFGSRLSDVIVIASGEDPELGDLWYANGEGIDVVGVEAEAALDLASVELWGAWSWVHATDRETGRESYGFPPQMAHARVTWRPLPHTRLSVLGDLVGRRPQAAWSPDAELEDGEPYGLLHFALATDEIGRSRVRADLSVRNALDESYSRPLPQHLANEVIQTVYTDAEGREKTTTGAAWPYPLEGEGRSVTVGLELTF